MLRIGGVIPLVAAVASVGLALLVYYRAPDRRVGRTFVLLSLTLFFWNLNFFALYAFSSYETALFLSWIFRTGAVFVLPAILHFSLVLSGSRLGLAWRVGIVVDYLWSLGLAILNISGVFVNHLESFTWGFYSVGTTYYHLFTVSVIINLPLAGAVIAHAYITTVEARTRAQLRFWLFGMAVALPLGATNLLPAYGVHFYPLGNLGSAVWSGIVGYAIAKHRLMDIEIVVAKGLSHLASMAVVIGPALAVATLLQGFAFGELHFDFTAAIAILLVATGMLFPYVQLVTERRLERALFRSKFESRASMSALAGEVVRILDRDKLTRLLCDRVGEGFDVDQVALYLRDEVRGGFDLSQSYGPGVPTAKIESGSSVARWLGLRGEAILREEFGDRAAALPEMAVANAGAPFDWAASVPFVNGPDLLGFMLLGKRRHLQSYSAGDLVLLNSVAAGAGIALQNARLYGELRRSREIIQRAGRLSAIGTLAAGIAHEVRNPLVSIQTFFQLAPGRLDDEEFMTSFLKLAETEVQRISDLISELLTFAKSPSPALEEIDLGEIAERTVTLLEPQARAGSLLLECRAGEKSARVVADGDRIMQVVLNLALNAIQATPPGGRVALETRTVRLEGDVFCQLEVSDTGAGIAVDLQDTIWDPFFTTKEKGSGLGLAVANQIIVEAGGSISFESTEGSGSRFFVNLPAIVERADSRYDGGPQRSRGVA
jgi:signal transduction histidine kinase